MLECILSYTETDEVNDDYVSFFLFELQEGGCIFPMLDIDLVHTPMYMQDLLLMKVRIENLRWYA